MSENRLVIKNDKTIHYDKLSNFGNKNFLFLE